METALTTDLSSRCQKFKSPCLALAWPSWRGSRARFAAASVLLTALVIYQVFTASGYSRGTMHTSRISHPVSVMCGVGWSITLYRAYGCSRPLCSHSWTRPGDGNRHGALRASPTDAAVVCISGSGSNRMVASIALAIGAALLIPLVSRFVGESYPLEQALVFGALMSSAGFVSLRLVSCLRDVGGKVRDTRRSALRHHDYLSATRLTFSMAGMSST